jgi:aminopeptidase N
MLRGQVGTDKFWQGIRDYYHRYRDGNASTDTFRRVMEENSGQELGWFFQQWLHRSASPVVSGGWKYNAESKKVEVDLAQTQPGEAYRLPLQIAIQAEGTAQPRIEKIEFRQKEQNFEIAAEKAPSGVLLDPDAWVLMQVRFVKR